MPLTKLLSLFLSFCLILEQPVFAQAIDLSHYFVHNPAQAIQSDKFRPLHLRYISYDSQANDFKVLLDKGDFFNQKTEKPKNEKTLELEKNTQELMKYFFIGLSLPNEKFWVNLRPDSPDNILDPELEKTDIGRIFLEADVQLKKDTASFTSPQNPEGKAYWNKLYKKAGELFGTENITIPTITRPWIVPNEIIIREAPDNAYIYKATLKVMLEEDYLNQKTEKPKNQKTDVYSFSDPRLKELNQYSTQLIKEIIIPKLTYEVNTSKRYAPLRQVYYSLILAQWFKQKYGSPGSIRAPGTRAPVNSYIDLIDSGNLTNLTSSQPYDKQSYFQKYQRSFKDGEYNLQEPVYTPMGQSIRKYVSGGIMIVDDILNLISRGTVSSSLNLSPSLISKNIQMNISSPLDPDDISNTKKTSVVSSASENNKKELQESAFHLAKHITDKYPQIDENGKLVYYFVGSLSAMLLSQANEFEVLERGERIPIPPLAKESLEKFVRKIRDVDYVYYLLGKGEDPVKDHKISLTELPVEAQEILKKTWSHSEGDIIKGAGNAARVTINGRQFYIIEPLEMFYHLASTLLYNPDDADPRKRATDLNNLVRAIKEIYPTEVIIKLFHDRWFHGGWKNLNFINEELSDEIIELFDAVARFDNGEYIERLSSRPSWQDALKINGILERVKSNASKEKILSFLNKNSTLLPLHSEDSVNYILAGLDESNIDIRLVVMERVISQSKENVLNLLSTFGEQARTLLRFAKWYKGDEEVEQIYFFLINAMNQLNKEEFRRLLSELNVQTTSMAMRGLFVVEMGPYKTFLAKIATKYGLKIPSLSDREEVANMAISMIIPKAPLIVHASGVSTSSAVRKVFFRDDEKKILYKNPIFLKIGGRELKIYSSKDLPDGWSKYLNLDIQFFLIDPLINPNDSLRGAKALRKGEKVPVGRSFETQERFAFDNHVSGKHLLITVDKGNIITIEDTDSSNGTIVEVSNNGNGNILLSDRFSEGSFEVGEQVGKYGHHINGGVSTGRSGDREIIKVDWEKDINFQEFYKMIIDETGIKNKNGSLNGDEKGDLLGRIFSVVSKHVIYDEEYVENIEQRYQNKEIILGEFIEAGRGVCRHQGLISAALIEHFIGEGYLAGRIYYFRGVGHAWAVYRTSGGVFRVFDVAQKYYGPLANARYWTGKEKLFYSDVVPREIFKQNTSSPLGEDNNIAGSTSLSTTVNDKGGIAFNALPIQTESVASSALGALPGGALLRVIWMRNGLRYSLSLPPGFGRLSSA